MSFEVYNPRPQQTQHRYTSDQATFLVENVNGRSTQELTDMFNNYFGINLTLAQIKAYKKNHGLTSGLDGRFRSGHTPFNKGKKGVGGWEPTQFKKGNRPHNYKPVGTERVNGNDYVDIKIADPNKWKGKHILIWEERHGPVPKGHVVIFGDGNRRNFEPDNLILVSRGQLAILNKKNLIQNDAKLTKTGIIIADIFKKISDRKPRRKG
ncbi:HNH endonuclease signature motif containing protein [Desulforamulus ruminis]|uniref:Phage protein n=1 Tax=Desulforamulus ruminis (strain ATCC 23193 / DSM 2154 / NCIMB 8452 / DL) TaxID=696281 RepID=F6DM12_DESRL|nr:HNH endonuclease signature motif containing protein [Desulforamulus ruminis]AEG59354.1 phage protein [Desulforamulus ruminis DSM 2154]